MKNILIMKKFFIYIFISSLFFNNALSQEYLDAYTLDKKEIEANVMDSVSDEKIKFKSIKNWPGSFENYKITTVSYTHLTLPTKRIV